jgi:hypothetical protein
MIQRIFKIDNTPHQDRYLLEIDAQFVHLTRYLFGIKREEIGRGHEDMAKKYPDYLQMPFEDWATLHTRSRRGSDCAKKKFFGNFTIFLLFNLL